jgi:hypothetical protein
MIGQNTFGVAIQIKVNAIIGSHNHKRYLGSVFHPLMRAPIVAIRISPLIG